MAGILFLVCFFSAGAFAKRVAPKHVQLQSQSFANGPGIVPGAVVLAPRLPVMVGAGGAPQLPHGGIGRLRPNWSPLMSVQEDGETQDGKYRSGLPRDWKSSGAQSRSGQSKDWNSLGVPGFGAPESAIKLPQEVRQQGEDTLTNPFQTSDQVAEAIFVLLDQDESGSNERDEMKRLAVAQVLKLTEQQTVENMAAEKIAAENSAAEKAEQWNELEESANTIATAVVIAGQTIAADIHMTAAENSGLGGRVDKIATSEKIEAETIKADFDMNAAEHAGLGGRVDKIATSEKIEAETIKADFDMNAAEHAWLGGRVDKIATSEKIEAETIAADIDKIAAEKSDLPKKVAAPKEVASQKSAPGNATPQKTAGERAAAPKEVAAKKAAAGKAAAEQEKEGQSSEAMRQDQLRLAWVEERLREAVPDIQDLEIEDVTDGHTVEGFSDGSNRALTEHGLELEITIVSPHFDEMKLVFRHRIVNFALEPELMSGVIHALPRLKTWTPAQAVKARLNP